MTDWILIPCLARLRDEFNALAPDRAKGADGSVGDLAHQERTSDHNPDETGAVPIHDADHTNEVHALDITTDLHMPGLDLERVVQFLLARCRLPASDSRAEKRLRYIIFNHRIWHVDEKWKQQTYTGSGDPHTGHAHFSASYDSTREASTASWHLEDIPVALNEADKKWLSGEIKNLVHAEVTDAIDAAFELGKQKDGTPTSPAGAAVLSQGIPNGLKAGAPRDTAWEVLRDLGAELAEIKGLIATPPGK